MANSQNPFAELFSNNDWTKILDNCKCGSLDVQSLLDTQRKNIEAVTKAQNLAMANIQELAQKQTDLLTKMVQDNTKLANDLLSADGTPEEKFSKNAELFKTSYERNMKNMEEIANLISKHSNDATDIISKRVTDSMNEIKSTLEKSASSKAA